MRRFLDHAQVIAMAKTAAKTVRMVSAGQRVFPVPRGGIPAAYLMMQFNREIELVDLANKADVIVDDLIDSGKTLNDYAKRFPKTPFVALLDKRTDPHFKDCWVEFPWELCPPTDETAGEDEGIAANVRRLLQFIGEDPLREGLLETPARVSKAWKHWASGYSTDVASLFKTFEDGSTVDCDEMVLVKRIPFYSHCEHHLAPFFGHASVAYIPGNRIIGLSKLARIVNVFARRLQVQERMTNQIADAINDHLKPKGVGVIVTARHLCMESRGIERQGSETTTSALRGAMRTGSAARAEFLALALK